MQDAVTVALEGRAVVRLGVRVKGAATRVSALEAIGRQGQGFTIFEVLTGIHHGRGRAFGGTRGRITLRVGIVNAKGKKHRHSLWYDHRDHTTHEENAMAATERVGLMELSGRPATIVGD